MRTILRRAAALSAASLAFLFGSLASAQVKNPDTYVYVSASDADTLDPAWLNDNPSLVAVSNIYDTLFRFNGPSGERLLPVLAAKVPSAANGLISADGRTYTIPIRKGVKFHDGSVMTPEDVRYSLLRFMLMDRDGGPSSVLLEPLLGYASTHDEKGALRHDAYAEAARAVQVRGGDVILRLPKPFAPLLAILADAGQVVSKEWAVKNGAWDGAEASWERFNNPENKESSPFHAREDGTGPYALERWDRKTKEIVLTRYDAYRLGPAKLKKVIIRAVPEFGARKLMLEAGDADNIEADRPSLSQLQGIPGVKIIDGLPVLDVRPVVFFTFKLNPSANPNIGSGKLDGDGIPPDFFSDRDVRQGFAFAFDYAGFIRDVLRGAGTQAHGCIPRVLPGYNPRQKTYVLDLKEAERHFRKAWGGKVWTTGFRFTMAYNSGSVLDQNVCQILKRSVESLNPRFRVDVRPIDWPAFLDASNSAKLPVFALGWSAGYPDAHDFAFNFMHSKGAYPMSQKYGNPEADRLVEEAVSATSAKKRNELYAKLQELEYEDVPHFTIVDPLRFRTQRTWVKGWTYDPMDPYAPYGSYFADLRKE